jgi:hypothetical protein
LLSPLPDPSAAGIRSPTNYASLSFLKKSRFKMSRRDRLTFQMNDPKQERRSGSRVATEVPATVRSPQTTQEITAVTRDLNTSGVFLYTDQRIAEGSKLEIVLILPAELGLGEKQWACCQASVVRVEDDGGSRFGVAASIERLDMLPEIPI